MRTFRAWVAMSTKGGPYKMADTSYQVFANRKAADSVSPAQPVRVLIVEDTEDNRDRLSVPETL